jgi:sulfite oxidase
MFQCFNLHFSLSPYQCGGNRREEMSSLEATAGSPWRIGAISNARWEGAYLSDVLRHLGLRNAAVRQRQGALDEGDCGQDDYDAAGLGHVQFEGLDGMCASVRTGRAMAREGDVLLAYAVNGGDIPAFHGHPLRAIVPGVTATRSVKHLSKITVAAEEAAGPWQRGMAYKGFNPSVKSTVGIDVSLIPSLQEQPVQSVVFTPTAGAAVRVGESQTISGYAYSGGGRGKINYCYFYSNCVCRTLPCLSMTIK